MKPRVNNRIILFSIFILLCSPYLYFNLPAMFCFQVTMNMQQYANAALSSCTIISQNGTVRLQYIHRFLHLSADGSPLPTNHRQLVRSNGSLYVDEIDRHVDAGWYSCDARDVAGQGMSRSVFITIIGSFPFY